MKKFFKKNQRLLIILISLFLLAMPLIQYWQTFTRPINIVEYEKKYSTSQYILGEASPQKISDSELYVFAGYAYLHGADPTTINFEHTPLAKYAYGAFYELFGIPYLLNIPLFLAVLFFIYQLLKIVCEDEIFGLIGLIIFGTLSLIQVHMRYALLDLPLLFGYLLFFWGLLSDLSDNKKSIILGLGLGVSLTVKYPIPLAILLFGYLAIDTLKTKKWREAIVSCLIAVSIYLLSYLGFFLNNHNLADWIAFERYRLNWFMGKTDAPKFLVLQTLFTGRYKAWWAEGLYETTRYWSISWPILFITSLVGFAKSIVKKNYSIFVLLSFSFIQLLIYGVGAAASDRFFITLLPFWVIGAMYLVEKFIPRLNSC